VSEMVWVGRVCEVFWMDYGGRGSVSGFGVGWWVIVPFLWWVR
jgi:hypothetical protein